MIARTGKLIFSTLLWGAVIFLLLNTLIIFAYTHKMVYKADDISTHADAVIILGSSVNGNQLSQIVQDRAEIAIGAYMAKKADKILISGDGKNNDKYYNEVASIRTYLLNRRIPSQDIFLDTAGYDTYDSLRRAQHIFGIQRLIIATQRFHLPRALFIADSLGVESIGIIADRTIYKNADKNALRESFARIKAIYDVLFHSKASLTTDGPIDIHGSGNTLVY